MKDCLFKQKDNVYKLEDYASVLTLLNQPSLYKSDAEYSIYRFLWMPSFDTLLVITFHMRQKERWVEWSQGYYEDINGDGIIGDWTDLTILNENEQAKYDSLRKEGVSGGSINRYFDKQVVIEEEPPFKIISGRNRLDDLDSLSMKYIMNDLGFWKDHPMGPCSSRIGFLDGSEWLFEAREGKRYKCLSRSNPGSSSKYYLLGLLFFRAAEFDKKLNDIY